ncbi:hypothetical protein [Epilithonimonas arachidiradicis]|uniref:hypothetical protein n=1 Tax=Epilithonimonas arachidiradicis TaxID=1617282 RepID=UPI0011C24141|nr:hypothetical protein [Epilithonimonas arachidiradicis]
MKYILFFFGLISLSACLNRYNNMPAKNNTSARQTLAKSFAENFYAKCAKKDYSEITGFNMDVNMKNYFSPEKIKTVCENSDKKYGKIEIGSLYAAKTNVYPTDFSDLFVFNIKTEKNDSIKYLRMGMTRDKDYFQVFYISTKPYNKWYKRKKK